MYSPRIKSLTCGVSCPLTQPRRPPFVHAGWLFLASMGVQCLCRGNPSASEWNHENVSFCTPSASSHRCLMSDYFNGFSKLPCVHRPSYHVTVVGHTPIRLHTANYSVPRNERSFTCVQFPCFSNNSQYSLQSQQPRASFVGQFSGCRYAWVDWILWDGGRWLGPWPCLILSIFFTRPMILWDGSRWLWSWACLILSIFFTWAIHLWSVLDFGRKLVWAGPRNAHSAILNWWNTRTQGMRIPL